MVHRSELGEVFHTESPRNTPVQQGLSHRGLQHADSQTTVHNEPCTSHTPAAAFQTRLLDNQEGANTERK